MSISWSPLEITPPLCTHSAISLGAGKNGHKLEPDYNYTHRKRVETRRGSMQSPHHQHQPQRSTKKVLLLIVTCRMLRGQIGACPPLKDQDDHQPAIPLAVLLHDRYASHSAQSSLVNLNPCFESSFSPQIPWRDFVISLSASSFTYVIVINVSRDSQFIDPDIPLKRMEQHSRLQGSRREDGEFRILGIAQSELRWYQNARLHFIFGGNNNGIFTEFVF